MQLRPIEPGGMGRRNTRNNIREDLSRPALGKPLMMKETEENTKMGQQYEAQRLPMINSSHDALRDQKWPEQCHSDLHAQTGCSHMLGREL